ncbi:hypothetical protein AB9P05_14115 [Roseivirga sp. BDSF3-8]|uniref:hypothetical protein n=1 Tax=Roseivirga sp. BDSF3-8 TaxID=3241598 RepID=UPI0035326753
MDIHWKIKGIESMAIIENNPWIEGARGMVRGAIVYRQRAGKTIVSARPAKSPRPLSEKQKAHHRRFGEATGYSKRVRENDALFAKYEAAAEGFISWQNLAVRDYMHAPEVEKVVAEAFRGKMGDVLEVYASDDFGICSLQVTVMDGRGMVLEGGECNDLVVNELYAYELKGDVDMVKGVWVRVEAADAAGNVTVYEQELYPGDDAGELGLPTSDVVETGFDNSERAATGKTIIERSENTRLISLFRLGGSLPVTTESRPSESRPSESRTSRVRAQRNAGPA